MTFEEFFKKKRIDLAALQKGDEALFSEFRLHFEQMGEKSFDHTKKYWFNKLRQIYLLPPEPKQEKVKIDNPLAEQTITESLIESAAPAPKLGFSPKFRAGIAKPAAPAEETAKTQEQPAENQVEPQQPSTPKPGFTPRFKAGITKTPAPAEETAAPEIPSAENKPETAETQPQPAPTPKPGFTPRFKASAPPKTVAENKEELQPEDLPEDAPTAPSDETPAAKPAYKPRFNIKNIPPKNEEG